MSVPSSQRDRWCRVLVLVTIALLATPSVKSAETFETYYQRAITQRKSGDFAAAEDSARRALDLRRDSIDARVLLSMVLAFQKRYDDAIATLTQGLIRAPRDLGLRLALARVKSWRGRLGEAAREVDAVLRDAPHNVEAWTLKGRIAYYREDLAAAGTAFEEALARAPNDLEALLGLGDVRWSEGRSDEARRVYRRATERHPDSAEARDRVRRQLPREFKWRLDVGGHRSRFSRTGNKPWRGGYLQITRAFENQTWLGGRFEIDNRFGDTDTYFEARADHRFKPWLAAHATAGFTAGADFRELWGVGVGGEARLWKGVGVIGPTLVTIGLRNRHYDVGNIKNADPGFQQYLFAGRLWLTGRRINLFDETSEHVTGWSLRAVWRIFDRVRIHAGLANSPETVNSITVETRTRSAGIIADVTDRLGFRLDLTRDDRKNSYIRKEISIGLTVRF